MAAEDRISVLPDELIQAILAFLPTAAAAGTSVLSRRWRGLWTRVPALSFHVGASSSTADAVDAALAAYSGSAGLNRLALDVHPSTPAPRIAQWLHFAARRLAGELRLSLLSGVSKHTRTHLVQMPLCEGATRIDLDNIHFMLRLPTAGAFASLRVLRIDGTKFTLVNGDVGRFVSTQCPRLRELEMSSVRVVDAHCIPVSSISISSASLARLVLRRVSIKSKARIEVDAPRLSYLALENCGDRSAATTIVAPLLAEVVWNHSCDPTCHRIEGADRQIYRLAVTGGSNYKELFQRFDAVDELFLRLEPGAKGYKTFIEDMEALPNTKVLEVNGCWTQQHYLGPYLGPAILRLLKKYAGLAKLKVNLLNSLVNTRKEPPCIHGCKCVPPESWTTDGITLNSLEELEIAGFTGAEDEIKFLKLLFECKIKLRRMSLHTRKDVSLSMEEKKHLWNIVRPHCIVLEFETTQFHR